MESRDLDQAIQPIDDCSPHAVLFGGLSKALACEATVGPSHDLMKLNDLSMLTPENFLLIFFYFFKAAHMSTDMGLCWRKGGPGDAGAWSGWAAGGQGGAHGPDAA